MKAGKIVSSVAACSILILAAVVLAGACAWAGDEGPHYYVLTESGSVYCDGKVVEKDVYQGPIDLAAAAGDYWVLTKDGSVYRNGKMVEEKAYKHGLALAVSGGDYWVITTNGFINGGEYSNVTG